MNKTKDKKKIGICRRLFVGILSCTLIYTGASSNTLASQVDSSFEQNISSASVEYEYSENVKAGRIRYISQVESGEHFHWEYWPRESFGSYSAPKSECCTASISMALSYLGINKTPKEMLQANNGVTKKDGWGATYKSVDVVTGMQNYLEGNNKFSPVMIHLQKYSSKGHYLLLVGQLEENTYQTLDPWENAVTSIVIEENKATYSKSGKVINETIDIPGQWYIYGEPPANTKDEEGQNKDDTEKPEEQVAPQPLSELKATALTTTEVKLSWKKQEDATGYKVYQKLSGQSYKYVKSVKKNSCKLSVQVGKKYGFKVVPYHKYGTKKLNGKAGKCSYTCKKITISAAGDCTLGVDLRYNNRFNEFYQKNNAEYFFKNVRSVFEKDDITIVNFEGTLTNSNARADKTFTFKGKDSYAKILTNGSVEIVNMANNHTKDFGNQGLKDTKKALDKAGIPYCIGDTIAYKKVDGIKIAFLGFNQLNSLTKDSVKKGIQTAKKNGSQLIITSFHWGIERDYYPNATQKSLGRYAIDQGANLVLGHHPHVLQGIERYKGKYIVYSLGNFCFGGNSNPSDKDTMIFQETFFADSNGKVFAENKEKVIPCSLSGHSNYNDFQPVILSGSKKTRVLNRIKNFSKGMNTKFDKKGNIS